MFVIQELLEEQLLYHATEKLSRIGTQESKIEMELLMSENALKKGRVILLYIFLYIYLQKSHR